MSLLTRERVGQTASSAELKVACQEAVSQVAAQLSSIEQQKLALGGLRYLASGFDPEQAPVEYRVDTLKENEHRNRQKDERWGLVALPADPSNPWFKENLDPDMTVRQYLALSEDKTLRVRTESSKARFEQTGYETIDLEKNHPDEVLQAVADSLDELQVALDGLDYREPRPLQLLEDPSPDSWYQTAPVIT